MTSLTSGGVVIFDLLLPLLGELRESFEDDAAPDEVFSLDEGMGTSRHCDEVDEEVRRSRKRVCAFFSAVVQDSRNLSFVPNTLRSVVLP
jgi:hypothetical protein